MGAVDRAGWRCIGADIVVCVCLDACICVRMCVCVCLILAEGFDDVLAGALWEQSRAFFGAMQTRICVWVCVCVRVSVCVCL